MEGVKTEEMLLMNANVLKEVQQWVASEKQELNTGKLEYETEIKLDREKMKTLVESQRELQASVNCLKQEYQEKQHFIVSSQTEVESLKVQVENLRPALKELSETKLNEMQRLKLLKTDLENKKKEREYQTNELTKGILQYKKLGLEFERIGDNSLALIFTQINKNAPEKPFSFKLSVNDDTDEYQVLECIPTISDMEQLTNALNTTGDFSLFVRTARKRFQSIAQQLHE